MERITLALNTVLFGEVVMNKELFGVFGSVDAFRRLRSTDEFDTVVEADTVTVGIRDPALSIPNRTSVYQDEDGSCLLWGRRTYRQSIPITQHDGSYSSTNGTGPRRYGT
ncbi:hypothetical protein [Halalkalicoccus salilacus]|uniref:hypothetical protein n=1 Tax=Halalkalicoccus sp. GCM10025704 TaxID=3252662 RepID=UPI0036183CA0